MLTASIDLIGFAISFGAVGQVVGPLLGGVLTENVTWRWSALPSIDPLLCGSDLALIV